MEGKFIDRGIVESAIPYTLLMSNIF